MRNIIGRNEGPKQPESDGVPPAPSSPSPSSSQLDCLPPSYRLTELSRLVRPTYIFQNSQIVDGCGGAIASQVERQDYPKSSTNRKPQHFHKILS
ncbi:hypothetical protein LENED_005098 [Lentinula edodes]|uniref:Uncharacterized protein n=1 Tax=Lentinula edodes TaxID=5353 RepID=A0A1Q3E8H7_LENED|nr:hypothetical protein LENED_005098 [Lentinula edodes]